LKIKVPTGITVHEDAGSNMMPSCSLIVTIGYLLVSCQLMEYDMITIRSFYLLESVRILPKYVRQFRRYKYVTLIPIVDIG
jgi:hypothetical protein